MPLIDGGTVRLPRIVGLGRALDLILTGRPVRADEALAIGLANRVVEPGRAVEAARELAGQIAAFPFECVLTDRASTYAALDLPLDEALRAEGAAGVPIVEREGRRRPLRRRRRPPRGLSRSSLRPGAGVGAAGHSRDRRVPEGPPDALPETLRTRCSNGSGAV
ncbi:hypothetical protein GCM10027612_43460 [Microbispora bryophytorum subsp. camponoti]